MPSLTLHIVVPAPPEAVFEFITGYPARGDADEQALQERYGEMVERMGHIYRFQETHEDGVLWQCGFDPPHSRSMRAINSTWSDRLDDFEAVPQGTRWTVTWETKTRGLRALVHWLSFQMSGGRRAYQRVMVPVAEHFRQIGSPPGTRPDSDDQPGYY